MSDLQKYVEKREVRDRRFAKDYDTGYEQFKIGVILKQAREEAGLTQAELAARLHTKKTAISRIENQDRLVSDLEILAICKALEVQVEWLFEGLDRA